MRSRIGVKRLLVDDDGRVIGHHHALRLLRRRRVVLHVHLLDRDGGTGRGVAVFEHLVEVAEDRVELAADRLEKIKQLEKL